MIGFFVLYDVFCCLTFYLAWKYIYIWVDAGEDSFHLLTYFLLSAIPGINVALFVVALSIYLRRK
jgi:hypothetical protein